MAARFCMWGALVLSSSLRAEPAAPRTFTSAAAHTALIELYTSEGCSSCPPAEKWLGELRSAPGLWREFVPVAFHVNYWDHLGWRDALASKTFTDRQHAYASRWHADSVYTPCFVRDGVEWRPQQGPTPNKDDAAHAGVLEVQWDATTDTARVRYTPTTPPSANRNVPVEITVALLGGGIVSHVRKGENAGRELRHEFVALRLENAKPQPAADGTATATVKLALRDGISATRRAIAAWVTRRGELGPTQATGGWID